MVSAAIRTHLFRKNTRVYRNTVTCVTRVTSSSNRAEVHRSNSQHLAQTSNIAETVPSGIFCLQPWILQRSEHISPRRNTRYYFNQAAINRHLLKYLNQVPTLRHSQSCVVGSALPFHSGSSTSLLIYSQREYIFLFLPFVSFSFFFW